MPLPKGWFASDWLSDDQLNEIVDKELEDSNLFISCYGDYVDERTDIDPVLPTGDD